MHCLIHSEYGKSLEYYEVNGLMNTNASRALQGHCDIYIKRVILLVHIIVEAEMSQKLSWRDLFVQIELGVDIASLGIK